MNRKHFLLTSIILLVCAYSWAQQGVITIHQDARLEALLQPQNGQTAGQTQEALTANGYRVQLYSSNAARKAKETALEWKATFEKDFPQHHAYLQYQAPFWKLRVGDFTHYASAVLFSEQLKKAYPKEADEIIIIKEKQVKPLYFEAKELVAETDSLNTILE
jgi:hypothetical protein